jgi:hypothetical protein
MVHARIVTARSRRALIASFAIAACLGLDTAARADGGSVNGCPKGSDSAGFWKRLSQSYERHLFPGNAPTTTSDPNAPFDAESAGYRQELPPPPVSNPPWPYTVWNEGGTELIGYENMYSSALMDAIYCGSNGKAWKDSRFVIYGWIEPGGNISTSHTKFNYATGSGGNSPAAYSFEPNTVQLDQAYRLQVHLLPGRIQQPVHQRRKIQRLRSRHVLHGFLVPAFFPRRERTSRPLHFHSGYRSAARAQ